MRHATFTGALLVLFNCTLPATPAGAASVPVRRPAPSPTPTAAPAFRPAAAALYSRRSRRLVQSYLRLKLLEMREADLERARKVVERKLGIKALLGETPSPSTR
ncbi:MAG TPA: hypothetical protein VHS78_09150 [Candidatus Elarobacter sp.]|nr:hypothetical protein [Candidatus Elarobacter sp.]